MSELELVHSQHDCGDDTTCSAIFTELNDSFDLVRDGRAAESATTVQAIYDDQPQIDATCANGVCQLTWKPKRPNAA